MGWHELLAHGVAHGGVVGRRCCPNSANVAPTTFDLRAAREQWQCVLPGVYLLPGYPLDNTRRTIAAALSAGPHAVVTGMSALGLHGLLRAQPTTVELLVPPNYQRINLPRVRTHWSRTALSASQITVRGVAVADVARSLADRAATAELPHLRAIAFDAISRNLLGPDELHRELEARQRFAGRARFGQLLRDLEGDGSESGFEFDSRERLIQAGFTPDDEQARIVTPTGIRRVDIPFGDECVGIECIGHLYHASPKALERDAVRANSISSLDRWLILVLTVRMFHLGWPAFLADLTRALDARRDRFQLE